MAILNPKTVEIGKLFMEIYEENCGSYEELVNSGAYLTAVHHMEIPHMLKLGEEAEIMWRTEALYWGFRDVVPEKNRTSRLAFCPIGVCRGGKGRIRSLKKPSS